VELTPVLFLSRGTFVTKKVRAGFDTIPPKEPFSRSEGEHLSKSPRGRPCEISDDQLEVSHAVLLGCLETYWHEIGWKLITAKTPRNVRNVLAELFQRHKSFYRFPFDLETEEPTTPLPPRHLRRQYRQASLDLESFRKEHDQDREQVGKGRKALSQTKNDPETHKIILQELKKREVKFKASATQFKEMEQALEKLRIDLHKQEAFFAESETFRFIRNPGRGVTPQSLAKAIAGLPYIGCEQSFRRCATFRDETRSPHINYLVFKAIRYIVTHWGFPSSPSKATELFKAKIYSLPKNHKEAGDYLKKHWPYLKEGIENSCSSRVSPRAKPYKITENFVNSVGRSRTPLEQVLLERENND
jgi:hypothetical protein